MPVRILVGDCRTRLAELPAQSVQTCVTSPPYFGLRDYGNAAQIGLERTPDAFVAELVAVFREVKRVLRDDGTLWLNLGDSYFSTTKGTGGTAKSGLNAKRDENGVLHADRKSQPTHVPQRLSAGDSGVKVKDLIGIPWRVAFALQADGWYLRQDIIWHKPNPMPESVRDRCTKAHEYIFLLSKSERYYYDADAIAEPCDPEQYAHNAKYAKEYAAHSEKADSRQPNNVNNVGIHARAAKEKKNKRSVWTVTTKPFSGAHFATFPPDLIEPCIKAGSKAGDTVLDPFGGAGTTGLVADRMGRNAVLCELNPEYAKMAQDRIAGENPMFTEVEVVA